MNIHETLAEASQALLSAQSRNILLVEDTAAHALLIKRALSSGTPVGATSASSSAPWVITHVTRASAALKILQEDSAKIALIDLTLPDTDGLDFVSELHECFPDLPIVVVTSHEDVTKSVAAMKNGAWDYVIKSDSKAFSATICDAADKAWKQRLDRAERKLAAKCKVAEMIKNERYEAMTEAIKMICAEVNNPLSALLTFSEILGKKTTNPETKQIVEQLVQSANHVAQAVQKLRNLSKSEQD